MAKISETAQPAENSESVNQAEQNVDAEQPEVSKDVKNMAILCHLLGLLGFLGPLIVWLIKKDDHKFIDEHGKSALNFQLSLLVYLAILCFIVVGVVLIPALVVVNVIFVIMAAAKASDGKPYRYPIAIRFLR